MAVNSKSKKIKEQGTPAIVIILIIVAIVLIVIAVSKRGVDTTNNNNNSSKEVENIASSENIINNQNYDEESGIITIELKAHYENMNSIIVTNSDIEKIKNGDAQFSKSLKELLEDKGMSSSQKYNIKNSIEKKIVDENTTVKEYYAKITGFNTVDEFVKFCEENFQRMKTENEGQE